jgi:hypothetical protein
VTSKILPFLAAAAAVLCGGLAASFAQNTTTPADAVKEARKMPRQDPRQTTSDTTAAQTVPNYSTADPSSMSNLYQSGNGDLPTNGQQRVGVCQNRGDPECQAVQTVQNGKAQRPTFIIQPTDPMLTNADQTRKNASSIVGLSPAGVSEPTKECTTVDKTTPGTTYDETCDIATPASASSCDVVWATVARSCRLTTATRL